ncbi:MAG: segregation/condensation protein A [Thermodesulfobacteriota bacterium]
MSCRLQVICRGEPPIVHGSIRLPGRAFPKNPNQIPSKFQLQTHILTSEPFRVDIGDLFEGPMDLLIYLIRKNDIDVTDISISEITERYLKALEHLERMHIEVAGDFLLMAATLISIKAKTLLPSSDTEDANDPRLEIARPIQEYMKLKAASVDMQLLPLLGDSVFAAHVPNPIDQLLEPTIDVDLFELFGAFEKVMQRLSGLGPLLLEIQGPSIQERIEQIQAVYGPRSFVSLFELIEGSTSKIDGVITFLAVLEMIKQGILTCRMDPMDGTSDVLLVFQS